MGEAALDAIGECGELVAADLVRLHRCVTELLATKWEVRCVVRLLVRTLTEVPVHRVAVLYGASEPYARLLAKHLGAAGINANGAAVGPVIERVFPCTLLGLLALPDHGWRRDEVMGRPVLAVKRYDRRDAGDGGIPVRVHQEDGCQATATPPGLKYEEQGGHALRDLAGIIRNFGDPRGTADAGGHASRPARRRAGRRPDGDRRQLDRGGG